MFSRKIVRAIAFLIFGNPILGINRIPLLRFFCNLKYYSKFQGTKFIIRQITKIMRQLDKWGR